MNKLLNRIKKIPVSPSVYAYICEELKALAERYTSLSEQVESCYEQGDLRENAAYYVTKSNLQSIARSHDFMEKVKLRSYVENSQHIAKVGDTVTLYDSKNKNDIKFKISVKGNNLEEDLMTLSFYTELPINIIGNKVGFKFVNELNKIEYTLTKIE